MSTGLKLAAYGEAFPPLPSLVVTHGGARCIEERESSAPHVSLVSPYSAAPSAAPYAFPAIAPAPKPEPERARDRPPSAPPSSSLSLSVSKSAGAIVNHLAKHGGWLPWLKLARDLSVGTDFGGLRKRLLALSTRDLSFTGKHPTGFFLCSTRLLHRPTASHRPVFPLRFFIYWLLLV